MPLDYPTVPQFQDLVIRGGGARLGELAEALDQAIQPPWMRDAEQEERAARRKAGSFLVYRREAQGGAPELLLFLAGNGRDAYVPNIVPIGVPELGIETYNEVVTEFSDMAAEPGAQALGLAVSLGPPLYDLERELGRETATALASFSAAANKATGSSHPLDEQRWFAFMLSLHRSGKTMSTGILEAWLLLDGWGEEMASRLGSEFEFGIGLLRYVDTH